MKQDIKLTQNQVKKRIKALEAYQLSLIRIGEQSEAAEQEEMRVSSALSKLRQMIRATQ